MPTYRVKMGTGRYGSALVHEAGSYKPGDMPPEGYIEWMEWAEVQRKAGIKQQQCGSCALWRTPQELSATVREHTMHKRNGDPVTVVARICLKCEAKLATPSTGTEP